MTNEGTHWICLNEPDCPDGLIWPNDFVCSCGWTKEDSIREMLRRQAKRAVDELSTAEN